MKIGINGYGRIGRIITRQLFCNPEMRKKLQLVAVNDLGSIDQLAFTTVHDSTHGKLPFPVSYDNESLTIDGQKILVTKCANPAEIPWKAMGVDVVFECTGRFVEKEKAEGHLKAGAKKVIVSAPGKKMDLTIVMGVNHKSYDPKTMNIVSNASCTTNCLAPVAMVLQNKFGIKNGMMTTVHSYTSDQRILDNTHNDPRRARTAATNIIPTTTGAAKSIGEVIPALKGKLDGLSVRVPTPNVSLVDFVANLERSVTKEEVIAALEEAAKGELKGFLEVSHEPLVSSDYNGCKLSSVVDADCTYVTGGSTVKVLSWYDNETGFSCRMLDLAAYLGERGL